MVLEVHLVITVSVPVYIGWEMVLVEVWAHVENVIAPAYWKFAQPVKDKKVLKHLNKFRNKQNLCEDVAIVAMTINKNIF